MSALQDAEQKRTHTRQLNSLTDSFRRRLLVVLGDQARAMTEQEIAARLATERGESTEDASLEERRAIRSRLQHVHLPKLEDVGLVSWNETDETVTLSDHPVHDDPQFRQIIEREGDGLDSVIAALVNDRRRVVIAVLELRNGPVTRSGLARDVASREADGEPTTRAVDEVGAELHHEHLPMLDKAGLIEYDVDEGTVAYRDHPGVQTIRSSGFLNL